MTRTRPNVPLCPAAGRGGILGTAAMIWVTFGRGWRDGPASVSAGPASFPIEISGRTRGRLMPRRTGDEEVRNPYGLGLVSVGARGHNHHPPPPGAVRDPVPVVPRRGRARGRPGRAGCRRQGGPLPETRGRTGLEGARRSAGAITGGPSSQLPV